MIVRGVDKGMMKVSSRKKKEEAERERVEEEQNPV